MSGIYRGIDPKDIPIYTSIQAARYLGVPYATVCSWIYGRHYETESGRKKSEPIIKLPNPKFSELSFTNLIEIHVLRSIRTSHRVSLDKIRRAVRYLEQKHGKENPLARIDLHTDGLDLFVDILGEILNISQRADDERQMLLRAVIEEHLKRIERDENHVAKRLYPYTRKSVEGPKTVLIDPRISFGRPVIAGTGIPTAIVADRLKAGDSVEDLARDYQCDREKIEEALRFEMNAA
jgi:uncharacterized protein (DUF433 family)